MASDDAWRAGLACSVSELTAEEANERSAELIIEGDLPLTLARRRNPWFEGWMYTKAIDRMLDIVDALQADFTDCTEGLVTLASVVLLRYLKVAAVDRHKIDLVAQVCLTVASKLNERMYVPLGRSDGTKEERFKCKLELELLGKLGWHIHASTPYTIKEIALEVIFECADPQITDEQRKRARKLVDVYLYLGIRDAAYLQLRDQNTALVAAAELSARKALSTQNTLEPLLRRFGLNGNTDLVGVQRMRRAMLDLDASAADPEPIPMQVELGLDSKNTARPNNDSPVNVWENLYDLAPKRPENPHASNFECDLDAASNAPTLEADEELAPSAPVSQRTRSKRGADSLSQEV